MEGSKVFHWDFPHGIRSIAALALLTVAASVGCVENHRQLKPAAGALAWPVAIAADPAGDFVYVVSTNFDSAWTGGTVLPIDATTLEKASEGAVEIGSFGGQIVVSPMPGGGARVWVPSRDMDTLEFADVLRFDGVPSLDCQASDEDEADEGDQGAAVPVQTDAAQADPAGFHRCAGEHAISLKQFKVTEEDGKTYFADNPYGVAVGRPISLSDGRTVRPVYVAGILGAALDMFLAGDDGVVEHKAVAKLDQGSHTVLEYAVTDHERVIWISNREFNEIVVAHATISARGDVDLRVDGTAPAELLGSTGDYFRGIIRSGVGPFVYAAYRSPAGLAVFEIVGGGDLRYRHLIPLDGDPAEVASFVDQDGHETLYVTENALDYVYAVDPVSGTVIDTIYVGAAPYGIAIAGGRAFVANFEDSTVSVFGVDPARDDYHVAGVIE